MKRTGTFTGVAFWVAAMLAETVLAWPGGGGTAAFRFVNRSGADIQVRGGGGFEREFLVDDGESVVQEVRPGSATEIAYWPPWGDGYQESQESPRRLTLRAPAAGMTNDVALTLVRREASASGVADGIRKSVPSMQETVPERTAILRFHNPLDTVVFVAVDGGLAADFEVAPGATEERLAEAGAETVLRYHAPYSGLYAETADQPKAAKVKPVAGEKTMVELLLTRKSAPSGNLAMLRLSNPNDEDVVVELQGGRADEVLVEAETMKEVSVRSGVETVVRYYTINRQYAENSADTAKLSKVTPKGSERVPVDLKLTKRAYPVVQLSNGGNVDLAVRVAGRRDPLALAAGKTQEVPVHAERKISIEWEAAAEGYLDGSRELGPCEWDKRYRVTIVPERRTPPSIRVRNVTPRRGMEVTVTRVSDGSVVEAFTLDKGGEWTVELPVAGRYRVRTTAIPDKRNDAYLNPDHYDATDETIECVWGKVELVECTANLKQPPGDDRYAQEERMEWIRDALVSSLKSAKMMADEAWGEHGGVGNVARIARSLREASGFARHVDADGIAGEDVVFRAWAESVAAKRGYRNAEWQRIVEATEASGSWTEFFVRYQPQE